MPYAALGAAMLVDKTSAYAPAGVTTVSLATGTSAKKIETGTGSRIAR